MENQNFDWKREWKDDQLEDICAFANTDGGALDIGKDNKGQYFPLKNIPKLLEDIPSKIRQQLGIIASLEAVMENEGEYIRIKIQKYSYPISYKGHYYKRSGSTTVEITGRELDDFILRSQGKSWDSITDPNFKMEQLSAAALKTFRIKAVDSGRLTPEQANVSDELLLSNLMLMGNGQLKRAAMLLFHEDPSYVVMGTGVKIAYFVSDADFLYQDEVGGPLITLADKVEEIVYAKYFRGLVSYRGLQRIENFPVPRIAFREAVLNAIVNKDYTSQSPIKIRVYDDKVEIYNCGRLPAGWTAENLTAAHESKPFNTSIANTIFRSGQIEAWGRGIEKINNSLKSFGKRNVEYEIGPDFLIARFYAEGEPEGITDRVAIDIAEAKNGAKNGAKKLTKTEALVHESLKNDLTLTKVELANRTGTSETTIERALASLKKKDMIRRIGAKRGGHWEIIDNP